MFVEIFADYWNSKSLPSILVRLLEICVRSANVLDEVSSDRPLTTKHYFLMEWNRYNLFKALSRKNSRREMEISWQGSEVTIPHEKFSINFELSCWTFFLSMAPIRALFSQMNRVCNTIYINKFLPPPGFEPQSLGTVSRWLFHYASVPHIYWNYIKG